jgi:hypothetical protein
MSRIWPPEMVVIVERRWAAGDSAAVIAAALSGKSRDAVLGLLNRRGLLRTKRSPTKSRSPHPLPLPSNAFISEIPAGAVPLFDLTPRMCRWPLGAIHEPTRFFCGQDSVEGFVYCPSHCAVAFAVPSPRVNLGRWKP